MTGLGAPDPLHAGPGPRRRTRPSQALLELVSPWQVFANGTRWRAYLTKDLFFSGHTATTFLLVLYAWRCAAAARARPRRRTCSWWPRCSSRTCTTPSTWWARTR